ncbi:PfkB family carbohydrate kinase [Mycobacterium spongiae]|uniref:Ribokinase n=1 Tax=Mycobacterium spongiae TaxID=886343 RepID=A0A975JZQ2_9MYCO|nr:PfkB family carbohydrate kinase [Mycobacterium spongiae]QUR68270.1 ribokinase [Mycobacterium spongiae]
MAPRVCVVGSANMDMTFNVTKLPRPGETMLASALTCAPGGKGCNQAIAAARAGARVRFVGAVGDDPAGNHVRAHLLANGIDVAGTSVVPGPSGTAVIMVDADAENAIVAAPGANAHLVVAPTVGADCEVLLTQLEIPLAAATAAARQARAAGAVVVVNASPVGQDHSSLAELAADVDVVIANEREAADWLWQPEHFVMTRGARGVRYRGADGEFDVAAPKVSAVDTTGAGDVFAGVLAAHWPTKHGSAAQRLRALQRASTAGALATLKLGAGDCAPPAEAIEAALRCG